MDPGEILALLKSMGVFLPALDFSLGVADCQESVRGGDEHNFHAIRGRQKGSLGHQTYFTSSFSVPLL